MDTTKKNKEKDKAGGAPIIKRNGRSLKDIEEMRKRFNSLENKALAMVGTYEDHLKEDRAEIDLLRDGRKENWESFEEMGGEGRVTELIFNINTYKKQIHYWQGRQTAFHQAIGFMVELMSIRPGDNPGDNPDNSDNPGDKLDKAPLTGGAATEYHTTLWRQAAESRLLRGENRNG